MSLFVSCSGFKPWSFAYRVTPPTTPLPPHIYSVCNLTLIWHIFVDVIWNTNITVACRNVQSWHLVAVISLFHLRRNSPSASVWTLKTGGQTQTADHVRYNRCSLSLCLFSFLWLLLFFFFCCWASLIFTFHLTFCRRNPLLTLALIIHPQTPMREGQKKQFRPWELPQTTGTTQRLDSDQLRVTKLQRL